LTATSADKRVAGWRFVAVGACRHGGLRATERGAEDIDGVALEAEPDVGIDGGCDADVGVAEEFLDHDEFHALLQEQCGGRMAEVVKADAAEASLAEERGEGAGEVGRVDRSALGSGEHVPVVLPRGACGLTLALLLFVVVLQRLEAAAGGEGDAALGGSGLGGQRGESACARALQGAADGSRAPVDVEVFPAEAEEFAFAESGVERQFEQGMEPVPARGCEELAGFVGGKGFEASGSRCCPTDEGPHPLRPRFCRSPARRVMGHPLWAGVCRSAPG